MVSIIRPSFSSKRWAVLDNFIKAVLTKIIFTARFYGTILYYGLVFNQSSNEKKVAAIVHEYN